MLRRAILVRGIVQGVGFRPFVYQLASELGLTGFVRNESGAVRIEIQGEPVRLEQFEKRFRHELPPQVRIEEWESHPLPPVLEEADFVISSSDGGGRRAPVIPADLATCPECVNEIFNPGCRRYSYPFTNCTNCGPRWSIIRGLPYDRPLTSMADFVMCPSCRREYEDPADRRFHAQPIACPACGPTLELLDPTGQKLASGHAALTEAARAVGEGKILALLGLGGFQLIVEATNPEAVERLRQRKRRPHKPFAIMCPSLEAAQSWCVLSAEETRWLSSPAAPILLVARRKDLPKGIPPIAEAVAPGNPYLGVMLPYTPLHHLLTRAIGRPIVCTSGNLSEEPMAIDVNEGLSRLGAVADLFLVHNRPIVRPVDDSVARVFRGRLQILRRARGFAPLPYKVNFRAKALLATGAHQKNTIGLLLDNKAVLSAHIGDLDNPLSVEVFQRAVDDLLRFYEVRPQAVACDLHPDYASRRLGEELAGRENVPLFLVQHHHAHVAACLAEHRLEGPVLGIAWDGTGYGPDGTVWGGEFLLCSLRHYERVATFRPFPLPGGDKVAREPRRSALGLLHAWHGQGGASCCENLFSPGELEVLQTMMRRGINSPLCSSVGRLFDAVAALLGLSARVSFEGQAAMELEFLARPAGKPRYRFALRGEKPFVLDWSPVLEGILSDLATGFPREAIAWGFHEALAEAACEVARQVGLGTVVISGGCFQNALLSDLTIAKLTDRGFRVLWPEAFPPNDGGIALGQLAVAAACLEESQPCGASSATGAN